MMCENIHIINSKSQDDLGRKPQLPFETNIEGQSCQVHQTFHDLRELAI